MAIWSIAARRGLIKLPNFFISPSESRTSHLSVATLPISTALSSLFERYGFPMCEFRNLLKRNDTLRDSSPADIEKCFQVLLSLSPSCDSVVSLVCTDPGILRLEFLEKWRLNVGKLGIEGITPLATGNVLVVANKFELSGEDVTGRVKYFRSLGFRDETINKILESMPRVIMSSDDEIQSKVDFLLSNDIQRAEMERIVGLFPMILESGVENRIRPLFDEFKDLGFCLSEVRREIVRNPLILGLENGEFSQCVELLRSLKGRLPTRQNCGEFRAGYAVKLRVDFLTKHGLAAVDAFQVLSREPRILRHSLKDLEKKVNFLIDKLEFDIHSLVKVPEFLGVSLEKLILPRFNVIEYLRSNGGLGKDVDLRDFVRLGSLKFYNLYVKPYPECKRIYGMLCGDVS